MVRTPEFAGKWAKMRDVVAVLGVADVSTKDPARMAHGRKVGLYPVGDIPFDDRLVRNMKPLLRSVSLGLSYPKSWENMAQLKDRAVGICSWVGRLEVDKEARLGGVNWVEMASMLDTKINRRLLAKVTI